MSALKAIKHNELLRVKYGLFILLFLYSILWIYFRALNMTKTPAPIQGTQVVKRIADLLRQVAQMNDQGARLVDLCQAVSLEQPTAHRLLKALAAENLVFQNSETKRYQLGPLVSELGLAAQTKFDIRALARQTLERIASFAQDTVYLLVQSRYESVCLDRLEGSYPVKVLTLDVGGRRPLGANASGVCILGMLPEAEMEEIIEHNSSLYPQYVGLGEEHVRAYIQQFKALGYADVSIAHGTRTVGLAIKGSNGRPIGAIAVAAVEGRMTSPRREEIVEFMRKEIGELERSLLNQAL